jgi:hypothetical protein
MKKANAVVCACVLLLTACGGMRTLYTADNPRLTGYSLAVVAPPNPTAPNIFIVGDKIVVDQEPIRPPGDQQGDPITIYFALEQGGVYKFQQHGIEIQQNPSFCASISDYVFKCAYSRPAPGTIYKYAIRVRNASSGVNLKDLDPTIWN